MIEKWESDLYEDPRDAVAAANDAATELVSMGYKVGEIQTEYVLVEDETGVKYIAGQIGTFYYGLPEDTLPGELDTRPSRGWALAVGGGCLALLVVTVVGLGVWGSKKRR